VSTITDWITAISAGVTATSAALIGGVWVRGQLSEQFADRSARRSGSWSSMPMGAIMEWNVRPPERPIAEHDALVVLEVLETANGIPSVNRAHSLRRHVAHFRTLSCSPTDAQLRIIGELRDHGLPDIRRTWLERLFRVR
jgi:hypothetical protein